jgi:hypothetical protein
MSVKNIKCITAQEYVEKLSLANPCWWDNNGENFWIFRGQSHNKLIPSLYRRSNRSIKFKYQEIFDRIHDKMINNIPLSTVIRNIVNNQRFRIFTCTKRLIYSYDWRFRILLQNWRMADFRTISIKNIHRLQRN